MRAALYARYSDDRQNERSIEDQLALLTEVAGRRGWTVVQVFTDAAISGAAMANRPGINAAILLGEQGLYDVLLGEDEDRLARDEEHLWHIYNRLKAAGVALATLTSERVTPMEVAFKGLMAAQYLVNLSQKTKRGVRSNAEKGLATGSRLYGYRSQPGGAMEIVPDEAEVVREIFARYAAGETAREIAAGLNARGVPGPRGGMWNGSTVAGSRQRANGILQTELYAGVKVWNRMDVVKDRATGRRLPKLKPESEWKRTPVPHLRILDEAVWAQACARRAHRSAVGGRALGNQRRPGVFSGLVKCGQCGASYTAYTGGRLICAGHRERGDAACTNRRTVSRAALEETILDGIRSQLLTPAAVEAYVAAWQRARRRRLAAQAANRGPLERRLAEVRRGIDRVVGAIERGASNAAMEARMGELDAERQLLERQLAAAPPPEPIATIHPAAAKNLSRKVQQLQEVLARSSGAPGRELRAQVEAVRALVQRIDVKPASQDRGAPVTLVLHGVLTPLIFDPAAERRGNECMSVVVAGGGYTHDHTSEAPPAARLPLQLRRA